MSKESLRHQIIQQLEAEFALQTQAAQLARDEATNEESRAENKYDTHSQEAAYLAEGQARLAAEASESIKVYQSLALSDFVPGSIAAVGALVNLGAADESSWYLLGPRSGGLELTLADGTPVLVVTPQSPMGRLLMGQPVGAPVQLPGRQGKIQTILEIK